MGEDVEQLKLYGNPCGYHLCYWSGINSGYGENSRDTRLDQPFTGLTL